ncbi:phospholipid carrier-dependent glycosyltransferase [Nocardioides sp. NBC_00368]|uniref:phospholipid carrier-dependent glycosyltransferase n=1 Tax=Nocardioides sp. NBC_00368 TaxID=2976000 RepID=UPI002E1E85B5
MSHAAAVLASESTDAPARPSTRLVVVLALLAAFAASMSVYVAATHALSYHARDEGPNASYAVSLHAGDLPTIDSPVALDRDRFPQIARGANREAFDRHRMIWTANHPPLYYLLGVPWVALADAFDQPQVLIVGMRATSALAYGVLVFLVGLIAFEVTPRRPAAAMLATAITASPAVLAVAAGFIMNDSVAVAASSLTVLATLRILRLGVTRNRMIVMAAAGTLAAATKAPGVITVIMCGAALGLTLLLRDRTWKGFLRATWLTAIATAVPGLAIGWFYVRNIVLYGDPTASAALLERYQRVQVDTWFEVMTAPRFWHGWYDHLWVPLPLRGTGLHWIIDAITLLALLGLALGVVARLRDHGREHGLVVSAPRVPSVATVGLLVLIAHAFVIIVNLAQFRSGGGNPHERYLMTIMPLVAIVLSVGLLAIVDAVPWGEIRRREEIAAAIVSAFLLGMAAATFVVWMRTQIHLGLDRMLPEIRPLPYMALGIGALCAIAGVSLPLLWRPAALERPSSVRSAADEDQHQAKALANY